LASAYVPSPGTPSCRGEVWGPGTPSWWGFGPWDPQMGCAESERERGTACILKVI